MNKNQAKNGIVSNESDEKLWAGDTLAIDDVEIRRLVNMALEFIVQYHQNIDDLPLAGSGVEWIQTGTFPTEMAAAVELAHSIIEPLPESGEPNFEKLLRELFHRLAPQSLNDNSAGNLTYVPPGGLFHAVLADFIGMALNRYVTLFMSAPGFAAIENLAIQWLCHILQFPAGSGGIFTSGGSLANFTAIHAARMKYAPATASGEFLRGTAYVSEQAHYTIQQGLALCGFPMENLRQVPSNEDDFRLCTMQLRQIITQDISDGFKPFLVVGMGGTTNTGAVDNLQEIAQIAKDHNLWFHVDAAYGGFFMLTERGRSQLQGIELADSVTVDPHKSMFLPYGTGALLVRNQKTLKGAFCFTGACMQPQTALGAPIPDNIMDISPELTRGFRGLCIWLPLKMLGVGAFRTQLDEKLDLALWATEQLSQIPGIRIVAQPQLSILVFKLEPPEHSLSWSELDTLNQDFLLSINRRGNILLSPFRSINNNAGEFCIRMAILSFRTHRDRIELGIRDIRAAVEDILAKMNLPW